MVSFLSESGVPFAQINSINPKMAAKSWNWYKDGLKKRNTNFCLEHSDRENTTDFQMFCRSRIFEKSCISFFPTRFSRNFKLNGKQPQFTTQRDKFVTQCNRQTCYKSTSWPYEEGREGVKWELGLALLWTGKMGFTHWDWDLATGNGMNNYKMGMGFLFFSGLCSNILK